MNNKINSLINIFPENMVHFIFLLKTSHLKEYHKIGFTIFDLRNRRYDFCKKAKNLDLNKRKGGKEDDTDSGPRLSGSSPSRPR